MNTTTARPAAAPPASGWQRLARRLSTRVGAFGLTAVLGFAGIGSLAQQCEPPPPPGQQQQVVDITNQRRAENGLPALTVSGALNNSAQGHSNDQAAMGRMTHTGSDGSNAGQRITRAGYTWRAWGENVAYGQRDAAAVMTAWMNSSGHRANILNSNFTQIGVGLAYSGNTPYWTMVLARPG